ncbi:MAG: acetyl-CoA carboxylase biotin carboxyl carrier protein [Cyclonatronaceae bacterium]
MDLKLIQNLLNMISESDVNEVSIEEGNLKIKMKKQAEAAPVPEQVFYAPPAPPAPPAPAPAPATSAPAPTPAAEPTPATSTAEAVKSPIVGTFYSSPNPESEPFVKVGDTVKKGDVLCIVEAMKIMNEIEAEFGGKVVQVLSKEGQPVEFDQPLFMIEPA